MPRDRLPVRLRSLTSRHYSPRARMNPSPRSTSSRPPTRGRSRFQRSRQSRRPPRRRGPSRCSRRSGLDVTASSCPTTATSTLDPAEPDALDADLRSDRRLDAEPRSPPRGRARPSPRARRRPRRNEHEDDRDAPHPRGAPGMTPTTPGRHSAQTSSGAQKRHGDDHGALYPSRSTPNAARRDGSKTPDAVFCTLLRRRGGVISTSSLARDFSDRPLPRLQAAWTIASSPPAGPPSMSGSRWSASRGWPGRRSSSQR